MRFYETQYEEYIHSFEKYNLHPELTRIFSDMPMQIPQLSHLIFYGPSGVGKYTQMLGLIQRFSPSRLKYGKKIRMHTEKQTYVYRISDIHYEVDMSLLGCNSKTLWHDIFFQIVDVISIKSDKTGIIVCKNFHHIHNELLDVFYSYMQQTKILSANIHIKFIIITESVSFIPNNIIDCCITVPVRRPDITQYSKMVASNTDISGSPVTHATFSKQIHTTRTPNDLTIPSRTADIVQTIEATGIINAKELHALSMIETADQIPKDIFNIICDNLIREMTNHRTLSFADFRDQLYDILVYNIDASECLWYIVYHFVNSGQLSRDQLTAIFPKIFTFLKYYNNNYRPIYHLESIFVYLLIQIHGYELQ